MQERGERFVCFSRNDSNLSMLASDSLSSYDPMLSRDTRSHGGHRSRRTMSSDGRRPRAAKTHQSQGQREQQEKYHVKSSDGLRILPERQRIHKGHASHEGHMPHKDHRSHEGQMSREGQMSHEVQMPDEYEISDDGQMPNDVHDRDRSQATRPPTGQGSGVTSRSSVVSAIGHNEFLMVFDSGSGSNKVAYFLVDTSGGRKRILPKQNMTIMSKVNDMTCYCVVMMDNYLYLLGGKHILGSVLSYCYRFNPANNQWRPLANMNVARARHTATVLDGAIYVCGGESRSGRFTDTVERFDAQTDSWTETRPMCVPRADHATVAAQGKLFVTGGVSDRTGATITFWQYDPATDFWTQACRRTMLPRPRERHSMVYHKNKLYCVGGVTINRHHEDVEDATIVSFDCSKHNIGPKLEGLWDRSNPDLDRPRCRGQAVVIGHYIYHIGGHSYTAGRPEAVVEHYNINRKRWKHSFRLTGHGFSSAQCCLMRVPTTNKHFSTLGLAMSNKWIMW